MPETFIISDTHFGHRKIIDYCLRPFKSEAEMNMTMVENWNKVVSHRDTVIHLGDVGFSNVTYWLKQLNGRKILIIGNHDKRLTSDDKKLFSSITPMLNTKIQGQSVTLCHYPMQAWDKSHHGSLHLHGHCHGSAEEQMTYLRFDMSVDVWNFSPVPWDVVMQKYMYKKPMWEKAINDIAIGSDIKNRQSIIEFNKQFWSTRNENSDTV